MHTLDSCTKTRQSGSLFVDYNTNPLTSVLINKQAIEHNIQQYKSVIGPTVRLAPVIKSNAYGHGMMHIADICEQNTNVFMLCVATLSEATQLRIHGITKPILVLSILDNDLELLVTHSIETVLYDLKTAHALETIAQKYKKVVRVHIKVDTGLSRFGIAWDNAHHFAQQVQQLPHLTVQGIFTHLAESEKKDQTFTNLQLERFDHVIKRCEQAGIAIPLRHASCSAATTAYKKSHYTMARVGIGMYGLWPSQENKEITEKEYPFFSLLPVLTWQTTIIHLKTIPAGSCVGYDRTFQAPYDMRIAVLPIGYWDGLDRHLSNKGFVRIHNKLASILGRIAMNCCMVDITHIPQAQLGDPVMLLGEYDGITAQDHAMLAGTINYDIVTKINAAIPRIVI